MTDFLSRANRRRLIEILGKMKIFIEPDPLEDILLQAVSDPSLKAYLTKEDKFLEIYSKKLADGVSEQLLLEKDGYYIRYKDIKKRNKGTRSKIDSKQIPKEFPDITSKDVLDGVNLSLYETIRDERERATDKARIYSPPIVK